MNVNKLKKSGRIIFETISGSHAYNLSTPKSDIDIRGFYINPSEEYLRLQEPPGQISDKKNDVTYYSLKRAFELLMTANPNMIELLWMPQNCIKIKTFLMDKLIENKNLFISKKCYHTHSGYAWAQIKKAKGANKKVHNPQPEERPKKEDFCWVIDMGDKANHALHSGVDPKVYPSDQVYEMPCRPKPLKDYHWDLSNFHVSSLEHTPNTYRLYDYSRGGSKGVFRGDDMLVCESIPYEHEQSRFRGLLIYNQDAYEKAVCKWHSYWDWRKNRNEDRWVDQENGKLDYDQKNLMHCFRLLMSGENILQNGEPIVRFEGEQRDFLMSIRNGERDYNELMAIVEERMAVLENFYKTSNAIPHSVNIRKINELYKELRELI